MRIMKDSGIAWIGEIPIDWNKNKVFRIFDIIGSGTTPKSNNEQNFNGTIKWIQSGDINGAELFDCKTSISENAFNSSSALKIYRAPYIIIAMYGASVGNISISNIDACVNQACCVLGGRVYNLKYAYYALKTAKDYLVWKAVGGGQPNISQDTIKQLWLPDPSQKAKERIARFLDVKCSHIDSVIEKTRAAIEEYKRLKQSVITQAVTKGIRPNREMKDSGVEWIGGIPKEWNVVKIKHLGEYRNGLTYNPTDVVDKSGGVLVLRSSNIQHGKLCLVDNVYVNMTIPEQLMVKKGDIVICSRNGSKALIGKCAVVEESMVASFGAFMMSYRCKSSKYMYYILNSEVFKYHLNTFLTATINQLTGGNFGNMSIVWCNNESEQSEIVAYLDEKTAAIDSLIQKKEQLITELEAYKKSLIYEYVTGKKEVV